MHETRAWRTRGANQTHMKQMWRARERDTHTHTHDVYAASCIVKQIPPRRQHRACRAQRNVVTAISKPLTNNPDVIL